MRDSLLDLDFEAFARPLVQPLSEAEIEVLRLVAEGHSNTSIARIRFNSVETIKTHMRNIFEKLEAQNRAQAVAIGFRIGVLA